MSDPEARLPEVTTSSHPAAMDRDMLLRDLTRRVADGTYEIDCGAVAEALLRRNDPRALSPLAPPVIRPRARDHAGRAGRPLPGT